MGTKKLMWTITVLVIVGMFAFYFYYFPKLQKKPEEKGAVGATEAVSKSVPEIVTNPAEKVPEVNPLDRANPFKYNNPLR